MIQQLILQQSPSLAHKEYVHIMNTEHVKYLRIFSNIKTDYEYYHLLPFTACAVATSCCISDVSSEWEGAIFDPP